MMPIIYIAAGGAAGAVLRYLSTSAATTWFGHGFPYGTMLVNVFGSLGMGLLIGWLAKHSAGAETLRYLIAVGFLGGFTTFSAFSLDVVTLFERDQMISAMLYIIGSVSLSVIALFAGLYVMRIVPA